MIVASVYEIYRINKNNNNLGEYLILRLNSGDVLHFSCYSKEFLYAIEGVIAQCFKDSEMKCKIDLKDCVITYQEDNMNIHNNSGNIVKGVEIRLRPRIRETLVSRCRSVMTSGFK